MRGNKERDLILTAITLLVGPALSWYLYGCLVVQFCTYSIPPPTGSMPSKDPTWLTSIVGIVCMLESGLTLLMSYSTWVYIVDSYSVDIEVLEDDPVPWSYAICPVFTGPVGSIVQIFLARRIWTLSNMSRKGCIIALVIILLASTEAILCFIITSNLLQHSQDLATQKEIRRETMAYLILALVCDSIITFTMTSLLRCAKAAITGVLNSQVNEIISRIFETGAVMTVATFVTFAFCIYHPLACLGAFSMLSISRLYTMTLLASLNGRRRLNVSVTEQKNTLIAAA